ncbi:MAG: DNA polymerase III subunit delta [Clostridia bacterium]|nr:DNA polymerase III subunit delta [Clostridia bacterium]
MPQITEASLKAQLKDGKFFSSYLIYGTEAFLKQHYANLIVKKCVSPDMEGFNLRKFDAEDNVSLEALIESTDTLPVFSEHCCTFMKNMPLDSFYSADQKVFEKWLAEMPETTVAVFWQDTDDVGTGKNAKWKNVIKLFEKYGACLCLDKMDSSSLIKTVTGGLAKRGCNIDRAVAAYLVETVGSDLNLLLNEVEKLADYSSDKVITKEDIDDVCTKSLEANVFDLSKGIISGNIEKALSILSVLFENKERPEMILGALCSNFIDMYRVKLCLAEGKSFDAFKDSYSYKNRAFRLNYAKRDAAKVSLDRLSHCIELLNEADMSIKGYGSDPKIILEKLIVELYREVK